MVTPDTTPANERPATDASLDAAFDPSLDTSLDTSLDASRNVLSQEELDFLLSPQISPQVSSQKNEKQVDAGTDSTKASGKVEQTGVAPGVVRPVVRAAAPRKTLSAQKTAKPAADGKQAAAQAASSAGLREQKRFFAVALERSLRRATGTFVGISYDGDTTLSSTALDTLAGAPACFVEIASSRGGTVFCLDNRAAQALVNASLGQGRGPARTDGPLSLFDRELVRRSLKDLGEAFAQAFGCPCAACVRLVWHADEMFRTGSKNRLCAAEFSMETGGRLGRVWLFAPDNAA